MAGEAKMMIRGVEIEVTDLTLNEVEELEEIVGAAIDEVNWGRPKALKALAFMFLRRDDPGMSLESVGASLKLSDFAGEDEQEVESVPPAVAASGGEGQPTEAENATTDGLSLAASGARA